jgi:hypothetical protein
MDFGYAVFERSALNRIFDLAIPQSAFKGDELPLLERFGELREIPPGLPAFLGCDVEDDVLAVVLSGFGFCVLSEAADGQRVARVDVSCPHVVLAPTNSPRYPKRYP